MTLVAIVQGPFGVVILTDLMLSQDNTFEGVIDVPSVFRSDDLMKVAEYDAVLHQKMAPISEEA